uniref:Reverse transcriptase domain-containing protein n=1 Tax=Rhabditophanes sp. KR3021 TaxID=114890 RepID=A0AC35UEN5_9BILA
MEIYKSTIRPVLTYACHTWALKERDKNRLLRAETRIWRMMLIRHGQQVYNKAKDKYYSNAKIKSMVKSEDIMEFINKQKLKFTGLIFQRQDVTPLKMIADWKPSKTRPAGRPCRRFFGCLGNIPELVKEKNRWNQVDYRLIN